MTLLLLLVALFRRDVHCVCQQVTLLPVVPLRRDMHICRQVTLLPVALLLRDVHVFVCR